MQTLSRNKRVQHLFKKLVTWISLHTKLFTLLIGTIALVWFLNWNQFTKQTYFSENALAVGSFYSKITKLNQQQQPLPYSHWIKARKGNGKQALALLFIGSKQIMYPFYNAMITHFEQSKWLHHDLFFLYSNSSQHVQMDEELFKIRQAIILNGDAVLQSNNIYLNINGYKGQLTNLDMVNTVIYGLHNNNLEPHFLHHSNLLQHWFVQCIGDPHYFGKNDIHAKLRQPPYLIHSITLQGNKNGENDSATTIKNNNSIYMARALETVVKSLNNLIESLHHSFFLYYLDTPYRYFGFEDYLPNLFIMLLPLVIQSLVYYYYEQKSFLYSIGLLYCCLILMIYMILQSALFIYSCIYIWLTTLIPLISFPLIYLIGFSLVQQLLFSSSFQIDFDQTWNLFVQNEDIRLLTMILIVPWFVIQCYDMVMQQKKKKNKAI